MPVIGILSSSSLSPTRVTPSSCGNESAMLSRQAGVLLVDVGEHREERREGGERQRLRRAVLPERLRGQVQAVGRLRHGDERAQPLLRLHRLGERDLVLDAEIAYDCVRRDDVEQILRRAVRRVEQRVADAALDLGAGRRGGRAS